MKVLLINGSAKAGGCTNRALCEVAGELEKAGIEYEIIHLGPAPIRDCTECQNCLKTKSGRCVFDDDFVNVFIEKARQADAFVYGSPVYYAHPSGRILALLDRAYYAGRDAFENKPAAAVVSARRGGTTAAIDVLNKYITYADSPLVSSSYWNMVHGNTPAEVEQDTEGLQTMRNLGRNMAWLLKCIDLGKKNGVTAPEREKGKWTNFIR